MVEKYCGSCVHLRPDGAHYDFPCNVCNRENGDPSFAPSHWKSSDKKQEIKKLKCPHGGDWNIMCEEFGELKEAKEHIEKLKKGIERIIEMCGTREKCACGRPTGVGAIVMCADGLLKKGGEQCMKN